MRRFELLTVLFAGVAMLSAPAVSQAGVFLSITVAPPALPVYVQPQCPEDGYIWNPGYWAYGDFGYYWVPGVWVAPPRVGVLWTPPYWGFEGGFYGFHAGYWGPHVGFYGGINYGFGYVGTGFAGGEWRGGHFAYNTAVTQVNTTVIHNTYNTVVVNNNVTRTSFNGPGGVTARPTPQETTAEREQHIGATTNQLSHERAAGADRGQLASVNKGRPATVAAVRPMAAPARVNGGPAPVPAARGPNNANVNRNNANVNRPGGSMASQASARGPVLNSSRSEPKAQPKTEPKVRPRPAAQEQKGPREEGR
jgi:hypothetical protein